MRCQIQYQKEHGQMEGRKTLRHRQRTTVPPCDDLPGIRIPGRKTQKELPSKNSRQRHFLCPNDHSKRMHQTSCGVGAAQQPPGIQFLPFGAHRHNIHRSGTPPHRIRREIRHRSLCVRLLRRFHAHIQRQALDQRRDGRCGHRHTIR